MQPQKIIFRDDDIALQYEAHGIKYSPDDVYKLFTEVDKLFIKYGVPHTIAVIAKDIETHKRLVKYIKEHPHIDVQMHCYTHEDFTAIQTYEVIMQLEQAKANLQKVFNKKVDTFYPPYNRINEVVVFHAQNEGLKTSYEKCSLSGYLRGHLQPVINFHYWADECKDLEPALKKYTGK